MLIGFRAARGVTYHASSGASTSRNVPSPSRIREIGEAVRRIRTLQWRELTEFGPLYGPETVRRFSAGCQSLDGLSVSCRDWVDRQGGYRVGIPMDSAFRVGTYAGSSR